MHPSRRPGRRRGRGDPCKEVSNKLNFMFYLRSSRVLSSLPSSARLTVTVPVYQAGEFRSFAGGGDL